jgi:uncharacterized protein YfaT (DUF1175 family)
VKREEGCISSAEVYARTAARNFLWNHDSKACQNNGYSSQYGYKQQLGVLTLHNYHLYQKRIRDI